MKLGLIGLPQTGKGTLFGLLTGVPAAITDHKKPLPGQADIRDSRFFELVKLYSPKKETPARIDLELIPDIDPAAIKEGGIFRAMSELDAVCHVVRAFKDDTVFHASGSVDAERDIESVNSELVLHDLIFIEKRLERIGKDSKKRDPKEIRAEESLLAKFREHLDAGSHLRTLTLTQDEAKIIKSYPFITMKRMLVVLNVSDDMISSRELTERISKKYAQLDLDVMQVSARLESEIAGLESEAERNEFMKEAGIGEPALNLLTSLAMKSLGLISFFTVGKDEVKQWPIRKGSTAPEAGSAIHSDIQRGFIRAEVIKYGDLVEFGDEEKVKTSGRLMLAGKDYIVEDGDVISFRFNV